tara:strand:+ start:192 stop:494 length:303 start_codon:yes stop_codon:yes gene_type:complete
MNDPISDFHNLQVCPSCGGYEPLDSQKCYECGEFHGAALLSQEPPKISSNHENPINPELLIAYSLNPSGQIVQEEFESDESNLKSWTGGGSDFALGDDEE